MRTIQNARLILAIAGASLMASPVLAQSANAPPAFDVASVKRAEGGGPAGDIARNMDSSPGHFAMRNVPLRFAIEWAYDLKDYEISGPEWIKADERYDIIANAPGASEAQMRQMLQTLLVQRFQMKLHRETKELPVYALLPGKGAPKFKEAAADEETGISGAATGANFQHQPISRFTFLLTRRMDRPVLDLTGLKGFYDFTVDLSGLGFNGNPPAVDNDGPSIFTAVQNDLGLKLEARKQPIEIFVLDSASKAPIEN
jgi:uncharacterized protein (TIGR03435 family)